MDENQITLKRPKDERGRLYISAVTIDSKGAVTPIFYDDWLKRAHRCGWKKLSQNISPTEQTELWELSRERNKHNGGHQ